MVCHIINDAYQKVQSKVHNDSTTRCTHHQPTCKGPLQSQYMGRCGMPICLGLPIYHEGMTLT